MAFASSVGVLVLFAAEPLNLDKMAYDPGPHFEEHAGSRPSESSAGALQQDPETVPDVYEYVHYVPGEDGDPQYVGFTGQALAPGGKVILVPKYADKFGIFHLAVGARARL